MFVGSVYCWKICRYLLGDLIVTSQLPLIYCWKGQKFLKSALWCLEKTLQAVFNNSQYTFRIGFWSWGNVYAGEHWTLIIELSFNGWQRPSSVIDFSNQLFLIEKIFFSAFDTFTDCKSIQSNPQDQMHFAWRAQFINVKSISCCPWITWYGIGVGGAGGDSRFNTILQIEGGS